VDPLRLCARLFPLTCVTAALVLPGCGNDRAHASLPYDPGKSKTQEASINQAAQASLKVHAKPRRLR
jgi:hypothetical protein